MWSGKKAIRDAKGLGFDPKDCRVARLVTRTNYLAGTFIPGFLVPVGKTLTKMASQSGLNRTSVAVYSGRDVLIFSYEGITALFTRIRFMYETICEVVIMFA